MEGALAGLDLDASGGEALDGLALRIHAEPALALLRGAHPDISDGLLYRVPCPGALPSACRDNTIRR
jgi:hypothetical protein